jgi:hypothetical protein
LQAAFIVAKPLPATSTIAARMINMGVFIAASLLRAPEPLVNADYSRSNEPAVNARITATPQLVSCGVIVPPAAFGYPGF